MSDHKEVSPEEHHEIHRMLHSNLDELFADFITHANGKTSDPILALITWSYKQMVNPDHTA